MVYGIFASLLELILKFHLYLDMISQVHINEPTDYIVLQGSTLFLRHTFRITFLYSIFGACLGSVIGFVHDIIRLILRSRHLRFPAMFYTALFLLPPLYLISYMCLIAIFAQKSWFVNAPVESKMYAALATWVISMLLIVLFYRAGSWLSRLLKKSFFSRKIYNR